MGVLAFIAVILGIYLTAVVSTLALIKLFDVNSSGRLAMIGGIVALVVAALEAPWYIDRVFGVSGNILKSTGAILTAATPIMVAVGVRSTAKRHPVIFAVLAGGVAIPLGLMWFVLFACMAGDCL